LQELQELQRFLMAQKGGLIANQTEKGQFAANMHFVNVPSANRNTWVYNSTFVLFFQEETLQGKGTCARFAGYAFSLLL